MAVSHSTPFGRLKRHYEDDDMVCPECGHEDEDGGWQTETNGRRIDFRHVCPSCGDIRVRTLKLGE
ncbi:MAG: HVO_0649 family zinc finger protein [Haloarculaceae archaeon]